MFSRCWVVNNACENITRQHRREGPSNSKCVVLNCITDNLPLNGTPIHVGCLLQDTAIPLVVKVVAVEQMALASGQDSPCYGWACPRRLGQCTPPCATRPSLPSAVQPSTDSSLSIFWWSGPKTRTSLKQVCIPVLHVPPTSVGSTRCQ